MSKHNYSQYSNKKNNKPSAPVVDVEPIAELTHDAVIDEPIVELAPEVAAPEVKMVVETVDTVTLAKTVNGVVSNCMKLNVRAEADTNADIVCVLDAKSEIEVDVERSTNEWLCVYTATGAKGYCMRKFVDVHL